MDERDNRFNREYIDEWRKSLEQVSGSRGVNENERSETDDQ